MTAISRSDSALGHYWDVEFPTGPKNGRRISITVEAYLSVRHVVRNDHCEILARQFSLGVVFKVFCLCCEPNGEWSARMFCCFGDNIGVFHQLKGQGGFATLSFLIFCASIICGR